MFLTTSMNELKIACFVLSLLFASLMLKSCQDASPKLLPKLGPYERVNGEKVFHPVRHFELLNQDGDTISPAQVQGRIRVADFFFISCPTICPQLQAQMLRIADAFADEQRVVLLSHTVDPKRDTVAALANYAYNLGVEKADRWHFLTGQRDSIYTLADDYFNIVLVDPDAPGGFNHSGRITVVDPDGYIRAKANGLVEEQVDSLIANIKLLLHEMDHHHFTTD
ncbi:MAG: SCO family protein [Bacteroidota bacterium]